jgi:hypothetical protein
MNNFRSVVGWILKLVASGLAYVAAGTVAAAVAAVAGLHAPAMPGAPSAGKAEAISLCMSLLLAAGLAPLAAGLSGAYTTRWLAITLLVFVNVGLNTVIETKIFMPTFAKVGGTFLLLMVAGGALAFGAVLARIFGRSATTSAVARPYFRPGQWAWRVAVAVLAFPVIYYTFGMMVAPFVLPAYRAGVAGLVVPKASVILPVQIGRSALYLLGSLPAIWLWARSRRGLILAFGWTGTVTTGLYGLLQAYWFPPVLRIAHSLEITADSFVYALVIAILFRPRVTFASRVEGGEKNVTASAA